MTFRLLAFGGLICFAGIAQAQNGVSPPTADAPVGAGGRGPRAEWMPGYLDPGNPQPPYVSADTPQGTGPHPAIMASEPGAEEFVAYYPKDLSAVTRKLPVVLWGNGSCTYVGNKFRHFLTDIASHDYFILAGGPMGAPDGGKSETITIASNNPLRDPDAPRPPAAPPDPNRKQVTAELLSKGIGWAIAENNRQGSKFYHRLDTRNIAVMGQSCGGGLAASFHNDKRVKTLGLWSAATGRAGDLGKWGNKPTLLITGDPRYDVAYFEGLSAYEQMKNASLFYAWRNNMTHLGTYRQANGGELSPVAVAWLDWQLKGDKTASKMFSGENCGLCTNSHWHVQKRHMS
jgi:hypothetical protein